MLDNGSLVPIKFVRNVGLGVILTSFYKVAPAHLRVTSNKCYMSDTVWIQYVHCKKTNCPWKARITGDFKSFTIMRNSARQVMWDFDNVPSSSDITHPTITCRKTIPTLHIPHYKFEN